jgi:hypothetical protein
MAERRVSAEDSAGLGRESTVESRSWIENAEGDVMAWCLQSEFVVQHIYIYPILDQFVAFRVPPPALLSASFTLLSPAFMIKNHFAIHDVQVCNHSIKRKA